MKRIILIGFIWGMSLAACCGATVWKVSKNGAELYIGGTIHLLRTQDYPLPEVYDVAYNDSEVLVFETDISGMETPEAQQLMITQSMIADGKTLEDVLSPEVFSLLEHAFEKQGASLAPMIGFKPAIPVLVLTMQVFEKLGINAEGIDAYYNTKGKLDGKENIYLESIEFQLKLLAGMGEGYEDDFVRYSLADMEHTDREFLELLEAWKMGDLEYLEEELVNATKRSFPLIYNDLFLARNDNWIPLIEAMFKTPEKEFVLVGLGHLIGKEGVLDQLEQRGFNVEVL